MCKYFTEVTYPKWNKKELTGVQFYLNYTKKKDKIGEHDLIF
jgi:hypothetical protein